MAAKAYDWIKTRWTRLDTLFVAALIGVIGLYLWKIPLGNADIDETFYLSVAYRMTKGDSLLVQEWHVSQLWSFFLYPVMKMYLLIVRNTDGIVLAFRYIFLVFHMSVVCVSYLSLRKRYGLAAVAVPILYGIFVPFNISALCYNSMGLSFCFLLAVLNLEKPEKKWRHVVNGFLITGFVLCNPYVIVLYAAYVIYLIARKDKAALLYTHISIAILAALFLILLFSRVSPQAVIDNFPHILSDAEHQGKTFEALIQPLQGFFNGYFLECMFFLLLFFGALAARNRLVKKIWVLCAAAFSVRMSVWFALYTTQNIGMNVIMLPLTPFAILLFFVLRDRDWRFLCAAIGLPLVYALCLNISSNQGIYVIADACAVSSCLAVLLFDKWLNQNFRKKSLIALVLMALVVCQAGAEIHEKRNHVFWEDGVEQLTSEISIGPLKGIKTTEEKKQKHEQVIQEVSEIKTSKEDNILFYELMPCGYFVTEAGFGTYSAWTGSRDLEKLKEYFQIHPEKTPDIVYLFAETYAQREPMAWVNYCTEHGYKISRTEIGNYLMEKLDKK